MPTAKACQGVAVQRGQGSCQPSYLWGGHRSSCALPLPRPCPQCWQRGPPAPHPGHRRSRPGFQAGAGQGHLGQAQGSMAVTSGPARALPVPSPTALPLASSWRPLAPAGKGHASLHANKATTCPLSSPAQLCPLSSCSPLPSCPLALPGAASVSLPSTLSPLSWGSFLSDPSEREPAGDKQGLGGGSSGTTGDRT